MRVRELTLIEKLESCIEIVEEDCIDNYKDFVLQTLQTTILKLTPMKYNVHSCNILGCMMCDNPKEAFFEDTWKI